MMPRLLVFDLDDTLFPEREFVYSGFAAVDRWLHENGIAVDFALEARRLFAEGVRGRIFDEALQRLGVPGAGDLVPLMVGIYRAHPPALGLFPDAQWAIEHFRGRCKLGLITDGYAQTQRNKVAALGISQVFDAVVFTDDLGRENWKPSSRPFCRIMEAADCSGADCVYVGDNPAKDFVAANRLNWLTVQLHRPNGEYAGLSATVPANHRAKREIQSLRELEGILS